MNPPAAYRKSVPCPDCVLEGDRILPGRCVVCGGTLRVDEYLPLRRLTDEELRIHASQLLDAACGFYGAPSVWIEGGLPRIPVDAVLELNRRLSHAFGADPPSIRFWAGHAARAALRVGHRSATRALVEVARRARTSKPA